MTDISIEKRIVMIVWVIAITACIVNTAKKEADMRQLNISVEITDAQYDALRRKAERIGRGAWTVQDEIRTTATAALVFAADNEIRTDTTERKIYYNDKPIRVIPARKEVEVVVPPTLSEDPEGEPAAETDKKLDNDTNLFLQITVDDLDLFARCIQAEAGNQDLECKKATAEVIVNRVKDPRFPGTVRDVIMQPGQFSVVENGTIETAVPDDVTGDAVQAALVGSRTIPADYIFFDNKPIGRDVIQIGGHFFGR